MQHLEGGTAIRRRISKQQQDAALAHAALEGLSAAVIGVDARGNVLYTNTYADAILGAQDGLEVHESLLTASVAADTSQLRRLITNAASVRHVPGELSPGLMRVARPSLRSPLMLLVAPLPPYSHDTKEFGDLGAVVFVTDPEVSFGPSDALLRHCYRLTPAECDVAMSICQGHTVRETATTLRISPQTVRLHLKHVFRKTRTHSQHDLVALLVSGPVQLHTPSRAS
jgi:DNA-binding CsgD family transcriptional regulator